MADIKLNQKPITDDFAYAYVEGENGELLRVPKEKIIAQCKDGGYYTPVVDDNGNLSWAASEEGMPEIEKKNIKGSNGKTAYQYALDGGYAGTEEEFAVKLAEEYPSKTSELENDSGFITKTVTDLANYYLKSETFSQSEINQRLSAIPKFAIQAVSALPTTDISTTTVYLLKSGEETDNLYTEYIRVNGAWEYLGKQTVDLTGYAIKAEIPTKLSELTNDTSFITKTVNDLVNYYTKTESDNKYQPKGNYLTKHQDLSEYAKKATTLSGYGIADGATKEQFNQLSHEIDDLILVLTESELEALSQEELAEKYANGTKTIIVSEDYENLVPKAISKNGAIYNGYGYMSGYRLNSSGGMTQGESAAVTGFIPYEFGAEIVIKGGLQTNDYGGQYVATYNEQFELIQVHYLNVLVSDSGGSSTYNNMNIREDVIKTSKFSNQVTLNSFKSAKYIRISLNPCVGKEMTVSYREVMKNE